MKKAWAVHLAEQKQGGAESEDEEEEEEADIDPEAVSEPCPTTCLCGKFEYLDLDGPGTLKVPETAAF